jgi:hypothetical protein
MTISWKGIIKFSIAPVTLLAAGAVNYLSSSDTLNKTANYVSKNIFGFYNEKTFSLWHHDWNYINVGYTVARELVRRVKWLNNLSIYIPDSFAFVERTVSNAMAGAEMGSLMIGNSLLGAGIGTAAGLIDDLAVSDITDEFNMQQIVISQLYREKINELQNTVGRLAIRAGIDREEIQEIVDRPVPILRPVQKDIKFQGIRKYIAPISVLGAGIINYLSNSEIIKNIGENIFKFYNESPISLVFESNYIKCGCMFGYPMIKAVCGSVIKQKLSILPDSIITFLSHAEGVISNAIRGSYAGWVIGNPLLGAGIWALVGLINDMATSDTLSKLDGQHGIIRNIYMQEIEKLQNIVVRLAKRCLQAGVRQEEVLRILQNP